MTMSDGKHLDHQSAFKPLHKTRVANGSLLRRSRVENLLNGVAIEPAINLRKYNDMKSLPDVTRKMKRANK